MSVDECRVIMSTNAEEAITHLTRIVPKPVEFVPMQGVVFACSGPKCYKIDGSRPLLSAEASDNQTEPIYTELWCARCGASYLITWKHGDTPTRVERRGWRDIENDGSYGRFHGHLIEGVEEGKS